MVKPQQIDEVVKVSPLVKARAVKAANVAKRKAAEAAAAQEAEPLVRAGAQPIRANPRLSTRPAQPREQSREPERRGATVVTGRDGEVLTRRRTAVGDIFHVPPEEIPDGWDYQWNAFTVLNQEATDHQVLMHANGYRPVPANRHPGRWTAPGSAGAIIVNGLRLEERPSSLGNEARAEDIQKARAQMRDQTDSLRLTEKLPSGFEAKRKYRGTGGEVRISIDPALDISRPQHEFEE